LSALRAARHLYALRVAGYCEHPMDARSYLAQAPSPRFVWLSLLAIWLAHALTWWAAAQHRGISLEALFLHYDAGWYAGIATRGYFGSAWAFYPLWPALVAGVSRLVRSCSRCGCCSPTEPSRRR
jgi:hypothetical protein